MSLRDISANASPWLAGEGPEHDVVISSRVRLARNIAGYPFLSKTSDEQRHELLARCRDRILEANLSPEMLWIDLADSTKLDRQLLFERHVISKQHSRGDLARGVALTSDEQLAIMVNEEDHIRLQSLRSGLALGQCYDMANRADDTLESSIDFAYSSQLGYLTACPTNVGTGIRVSVMLHLPALKLTGEIDKVQRAAKDMHLAVRGFYGEGSDATADLFQVSNQTTLGKTEPQILEDFERAIIPQIITYERRARAALVADRAAVLDDRIFRSLATLTHARLLGSEEALLLLSFVRLGVCTGRIPDVKLKSVNELFLLTQPGHLQKIAARQLNGAERREFRAKFVREHLAQSSS